MNSDTTRYTADINLRGMNDPHVLAIGRVPANSNVLDLGAADGSVAAVLRDMGCRVWAVENDPVAAEEAKRICEEVVVEDLNYLDLAQRFSEQRFDVVLMLDVLEHLSEPSAALRGVSSVLAEGGWGVISLPNIAHVSARLALLQGRFTYTEMGLLDSTHLRFFDRAGVDDLLQQAGWGMFDLARVTRRLGTTEIQLEGVDPELTLRLESDIEGLTYQFVVSAAPIGSPVLDRPPVLPAAVAQAAYLALEREAGAQIPDLMDHLTVVRQGSLERRNQLKNLLQAIREDAERIRISLSD